MHIRMKNSPCFLTTEFLAWFLEIALVRASVCVCVCVCVSAPEAINNQWRDMVRYRPCAIG